MFSKSSERGEPVVIVGAGLAGLTAGLVLSRAQIPYVILEAGERMGGLCRSEMVGGFTFDYTGHLLHLREGESRDLILGLVGENLAEHQRKASVHVMGTFVPYPIQAHFGKLPAHMAARCMDDLIKASTNNITGEMPFPEWARAQFGSSLSEIFMIPYNRKLFIHPLEEMETSWTSWSVPRPTLEEIRLIAAGGKAPSFGYNATFHYPRNGGIEVLPEMLARGQGERIRTGERVRKVDALKKTVTVESGEEIPFGRLVSTMPLPDLLGSCEGLEREIVDAGRRFRHSSVLGVCLGLDGPVRTKDHWIYFPGEGFPFYRIGFPTSFSKDAAPDGCGSLYAEAAFRPGTPPDADGVARAAMGVLRDSGLIGASTRAAVRLDLEIPCAYVFHDRHRAASLGRVLDSLRERRIHSIGRYGAWEYSGMQQAVEGGLAAAREVLS